MNLSRSTFYNNDFYGIERTIYEAICRFHPGFALGGQISDINLLNDLEEQLRETMIKRDDGSRRLVLDLALTKAMGEMRRRLLTHGRLFVPPGLNNEICRQTGSPSLI
jgi:hypothetical protein